MTLVERDPEFRERLIALYLDNNLGKADAIIHHAVAWPEHCLAGPEHGRRLVFGLELWAAIFGHRHPAIRDAGEIPWQMMKCWRHATTAEHTLTALRLLSEPPCGAEFAEDIHSLRPRLAAIAEKHAERKPSPSLEID